MATRRRSVSVARIARSSGPLSFVSSLRARISSGSMITIRRRRTVSIARFRAMVSSQAVTVPRRGSKADARCHARRNVSWATSSARRGSWTIRSATPKTRRWKRSMNAAAASGSPVARPSSNASSDTTHTAGLRPRPRLGLRGGHDVTVATPRVQVRRAVSSIRREVRHPALRSTEEDVLPTPAADVAHLLRRAGFGGTQTQIDALTPLDLPAIVDQLLDFTPNPADTPPASLGDADVGDWEQVVHLQQWWLDRMATVPRPLQEKLALFWHGHFATGQEKVNSARDMFDQNHLFRTDGLGSFENLVQKMSLQVAMLIYLDNDPNEKGSPNENFARELLELFTLGVNQYTQADIVAAAKAWTGHNVDYDATPRVYRFYPTRHDDGNKTFMGTTQTWDGPQIITRVLTVEPQRSIAARFVAKKLWTFFAYSNPSATVLDPIVADFVGSNLDIRTVLRSIFLHPEFYSTTAKQGLVRSPVEWVVTCLKGLGFTAAQTNPQW